MGERISTGIRSLDETIEGGFKRNSINLLVGGPGSGKSVFAMQFLLKGVLESGESGAYISFEETKEKIHEDMAGFGWDLESLEKQKRLSILSLEPSEFRKDINKEGWYLLYHLIEEVKAKRIVLDSISAYSFLFSEEAEKREELRKLFEAFRKLSCTSLLITEKDVMMGGKIARSDLLEFLADSVTLLYTVRKGDIRERALEVKKIRGTRHTPKIFPMKITDGGIVVFPDETVF